MNGNVSSCVEQSPFVIFRNQALDPNYRISTDQIAQLVQHSVFGSAIKKPKLMVTENQDYLTQTIVVRVNVSDDFFGKPKLKICDEFFGLMVDLTSCVSDRNLFFEKLLFAPVGLRERLRRKVDVMEKELDTIGDFNRVHFLLTEEQMFVRNYPYVGQYRIVPTKEKYDKVTSMSPLFSIDCEMCATTHAHQELARVSIVDEQGKVVLDTLVLPKGRVTNYMTQYSGITHDMMLTAKATLEDVQRAIQSILPPDAILVGHTLQHDLRVLKMTHPYCLDVSTVLNLTKHENAQTSLKNLTRVFLDEHIQDGFGHCSVEDAWAAMRLAQMKIENGYLFGHEPYGWKRDGFLPFFEYGKIEEKRENAPICTECPHPTIVKCSIRNCPCQIAMASEKCVMCIQTESKQGEFDSFTITPRKENEVPSVIEGYLEPPATILCALEKNSLNFQFDMSKRLLCRLPSWFLSQERFLESVTASIPMHRLCLVEIDANNLKLSKTGGDDDDDDEDVPDVVNRKLEELVDAARTNALILLVLSSPTRNILFFETKGRVGKENHDNY